MRKEELIRLLKNRPHNSELACIPQRTDFHYPTMQEEEYLRMNGLEAAYSYLAVFECDDGEVEATIFLDGDDNVIYANIYSE